MTGGGSSIHEIQRLLAVLAVGRRVAEAGTAFGDETEAMAQTAKSVVTVELDPVAPRSPPEGSRDCRTSSFCSATGASCFRRAVGSSSCFSTQAGSSTHRAMDIKVVDCPLRETGWHRAGVRSAGCSAAFRRVRCRPALLSQLWALASVWAGRSRRGFARSLSALHLSMRFWADQRVFGSTSGFGRGLGRMSCSHSVMRKARRAAGAR